MNRIIDQLGPLAPYAKAFVIVAAIVLAGLAQAAGVDLGLNVDDLWQALGATVLVYLVPNRDADRRESRR